jgi:tetratricopeptide (TPR) repeat protein
MTDRAEGQRPRRRRRSRESAPTTPDPVDIAMQAEKSGRPAEGAAHAVLVKHARLLDAQLASERLSITLKVLSGLVGLGVALAAALLVWNASRADGLIVHAFTVPPDLAARGLTGEVVASRVLDRMAQLAREANTAQPASRYESDWTQNSSVEIPQTGVSITELDRLLRAWLGHETHLRGEVVRTTDGLAVTARAGTVATAAHTGLETQVDPLIASVAEDAFARTQPRRYAVWLLGQDRNAEALAVYDAVIATGTDEQRAWAYSGRATVLVRSNPIAARAAALQAIRLDPKGSTSARSALGTVEVFLGHSEARLANLRAEAKMTQRDHALRADYRRQQAILQSAQEAALLGDFPQARTKNALLKDQAMVGGVSTRNPLLNYLGALSRMHEHSAALAATDAYLAGRRTLTQRELDARKGARAQAAAEFDDWSGWIAAEDASRRDLGELLWRPRPAFWAPTAVAYARLGRFAEAEAWLAPTGLDCVPCVVARGEVAAEKGDWAAADRWFASAASQAPSFPFAHTAWGKALLKKGDPDGAIDKLKQAHKRSPHFADPLELWGEALLAKGDLNGAVKKFREANDGAPRWGRNHLRWGEALARLGKAEDAKAQWRAAASMDLSVADRARVNALISQARS